MCCRWLGLLRLNMGKIWEFLSCLIGWFDCRMCLGCCLIWCWWICWVGIWGWGWCCIIFWVCCVRFLSLVLCWCWWVGRIFLFCLICWGLLLVLVRSLFRWSCSWCWIFWMSFLLGGIVFWMSRSFLVWSIWFFGFLVCGCCF